MPLTKFPGVAVILAGASLVIPALSLRQIQGLQARLAGYTGGMDADSTGLVLDTVHAALTRNYPDVTLEQVADWVDMRNMRELMDAVMGVSGLAERVESGEAQATATP